MLVALDGEDHPVPALAYPLLVGPVGPGERVLVNTTAVELGLGTGGMHFVVAVLRQEDLSAPERGRIMKLRYTPHQVNVLTAEEPGSPYREAMEAAEGLDGTPVVWVPLHSMLGPVAAGDGSWAAAKWSPRPSRDSALARASLAAWAGGYPRSISLIMARPIASSSPRKSTTRSAG